MRSLVLVSACLALCGCAAQSAKVPAAVAAAVPDQIPTTAWSEMPTYFSCHFETHVVSAPVFGGGTFVPKAHTYPLSRDALVYSQIDTQKGTARIGYNRAVVREVSLVINAGVWTFLDLSEPGEIGVTSIIVGVDPVGSIGIHPAIDSRHLVRGRGAATQQYGSCEAIFT